MKVNFTRKPTPEEIYPRTEAVIEKVVRLSKGEFEDLIRNPLLDRSYVKENKGRMFEDDKGFMSLNESRALLGLEPVEGGDKRLQSLNYVDASKANKYQVDENEDSSKEDKNDEQQRD